MGFDLASFASYGMLLASVVTVSIAFYRFAINDNFLHASDAAPTVITVGASSPAAGSQRLRIAESVTPAALQSPMVEPEVLVGEENFHDDSGYSSLPIAS
jgi:hypothetical protein